MLTIENSITLLDLKKNLKDIFFSKVNVFIELLQNFFIIICKLFLWLMILLSLKTELRPNIA